MPVCRSDDGYDIPDLAETTITGEMGASRVEKTGISSLMMLIRDMICPRSNFRRSHACGPTQ